MIKIIGGSGFVGSFLIDELKSFEVQNLDKNSSPFFNEISVLHNCIFYLVFYELFLFQRFAQHISYISTMPDNSDYAMSHIQESTNRILVTKKYVPIYYYSRHLRSKSCVQGCRQ